MYLLCNDSKRLPTILDKLRRYPATSLAKMQDIGGARAICKSIEDIKKIEELLNNKDK
mgnify:FL=1